MLLISRPAGVLSSSVIRQLSISSYRLHPQRELIVRKKRGRVPWSSATIYSVVMAGKLGVHLNGRVKSGQRWSGQNRPTDVARDSDVLPCRLHIRQA